MHYYIINKNTDENGYNEVHRNTCGHLPEPWNQEALGWFDSGSSAVSYAKANGYPNADGCWYCCREEHRG